MPRRDGTGPIGRGPRTGRGMGCCNSTKTSDAAGGLGCRRGCRRDFFTNSVNSKIEKDLLMEEKTFLENRLNSVNNQLNTL